LPALEFCKLYSYTYRLLELETSKRSNKTPLDKNTVAMMCYCAIHCATLGEVITRISDFLKVLGENGAKLNLSVTANQATLTLDAYRGRNDSASLLVCMSAFNLFYQLFSWMTGEHLSLDKITVQYPEPKYAGWMMTFFKAPVAFESVSDSLIFPANFLQKPVIRSYQELQEIIGYLPFDALYADRADVSMAKKIQVIIFNSLHQKSTVPSFDLLAQMFCKSPATLRRRLKDDGCSYLQIVSDCQQSYAEDLLSNSELRIGEVALKVGFTDDRSFRRSFQRWHQCTPNQYRKQS
jgi:AraC-like DNA-binding protein